MVLRTHVGIVKEMGLEAKITNIQVPDENILWLYLLPEGSDYSKI